MPSLQKIQTATTYFSEEENISVLPVVLGLAENLHADLKDSPVVQIFKQTVKTVILRQWDTDQLSPVLLLSVALDPHFILLKQLDESLKENIKEVVISNVERVVGDIDCTMANSDITQSSSSQDPPMAKKAKPST